MNENSERLPEGFEYPILPSQREEVPEILPADKRAIGGRIINSIELRMKFAGNGDLGVSGIPTGWTDLDKTIDGLSGLVAIGARTEINMRDFALNLAFNASQAKKPNSEEEYRVAYIAPNEDAEMLMKRMLLSQAGVSLRSINEGLFSEERDCTKIVNSLGKIVLRDNIQFYTSTFDSYMLNVHCGRLQEREGLDLVVLDRLQSLSDFGKKEEGSGYQKSLEIKMYLKEMVSSGLSVVVLSELKKRREKGVAPSVNDLRDYAMLEYDASPILLLYQPPDGSDENSNSCSVPVNVRVRNNMRGFYTDDVALTYLTAFGRFESAAKVDLDGE